MRIQVATALFITISLGQPAWAQLMLHNGPDTAPSSKGSSSEAGASAPEKPKSIPMKLPNEDSLIGHDLLRDGASGVMTIVKQGKDISISHLGFDGESISKPGDKCHVDIDSSQQIATRFDGRPDGLSRYRADLKACPFSFDVLENAVLVSKGQACDFAAADCHIDPAGLWGPQGNTIGAARVKDMEQQRLRIESDMRANFKVLLSRAGKDKYAMKRIAAEQAGFSSERETLCHFYALESVHGFCALEITRARVLALLAQIGASPEKDDAIHHAKKKQKPPAIAAQPPPAAE